MTSIASHAMELSANNIVQATEPKPKVNRFSFLDALRGIASFWVVLYHAESGGHTPVLQETLPVWLFELLFRKGFLGVPIFFVLSGFVIAHSVRKAYVNWPYFSNFISRRFARISPPYYAAMVLVLILSFVAAKVEGETYWFPSVGNIAAHLAYVQRIFQFRDVNPAFWTLCIEMQFYLTYCALIAIVQRINGSQRQDGRGQMLWCLFPVPRSRCSGHSISLTRTFCRKPCSCPIGTGFCWGFLPIGPMCSG